MSLALRSAFAALLLTLGYGCSLTNAPKSTGFCAASEDCGSDETCCAGQCVQGDRCSDWDGAQVIGPAFEGSAGGAQVAIDSRGNAFSLWQQSVGTRQNIWGNRYTSAEGWGSAELVVAEDAGDSTHPQLAMDGQGNALAVFEQADGASVEIWAKRFDASEGWGEAERVGEEAGGPAKLPQVALDTDGRGLAVWAQSDGTHDGIWASRYDATEGWSSPERIDEDEGNAREPRVEMDEQGDAVVVWQQSDGRRDNIWANRHSSTEGWAGAERIEDDDVGNATGVELAVDAQGNARAVWHQSDGTRMSIWSNRYLVAQGWGTAELVEDDDGSINWEAEVGIDAQGRALALWQHASDQSIWANRYTPELGWGTAGPIEPQGAGGVGRSSAPQIAVALSGEAFAVWEHEDATRTSIRAGRYTPDEGWAEPQLIESDLSGNAGGPTLAMAFGGEAVAVWSQFDGMRDRTWASHSASCSGEDCEAKGACTSPSDEEIWLDPNTRDAIEACSLAALLDEGTALQVCIEEQTGFSTMCSECWVGFTECVLANCVDRCQPDSESPGCADCLSQHCVDDTELCAGQPLPF